eukprot:TRINITY_DN35006_c0_g1_i1.p1 TRINITY_DN35006_c0_g1~~TRINITY_DN35006_c0_g1_i1.p1  ORF type:complete len:516 (+),score=127.57 TRINITY_DN35006_c0_g1_i1:44-1591(+)
MESAFPSRVSGSSGSRVKRKKGSSVARQQPSSAPRGSASASATATRGVFPARVKKGSSLPPVPVGPEKATEVHSERRFSESSEKIAFLKSHSSVLFGSESSGAARPRIDLRCTFSSDMSPSTTGGKMYRKWTRLGLTHVENQRESSTVCLHKIEAEAPSMTRCWFRKKELYDGRVPMGSVQIVGSLEKVLECERSFNELASTTTLSRRLSGTGSADEMVMEIPLMNCYFLVVHSIPYVSEALESVAEEKTHEKSDAMTEAMEALDFDPSESTSVGRSSLPKRYAWLYFRPVSIVLDLDMTLVHCIELTRHELIRIKDRVRACGISWELFLRRIDGFEFHHQYEDEEEATHFLGKFRDGMREFLGAFQDSPLVEMFLCSMGTQPYVKKIVDLLPHGTFKRVWAREDLDRMIDSVQKRRGGFLKRIVDLDFHFDLRRTMVIDDSPEVWAPDDRHRLFVVNKFAYFPPLEDILTLDFSGLKKKRDSSSAYLVSVRDDMLRIIKRFSLEPELSVKNVDL